MLALIFWFSQFVWVLFSTDTSCSYSCLTAIINKNKMIEKNAKHTIYELTNNKIMVSLHRNNIRNREREGTMPARATTTITASGERQVNMTAVNVKPAADRLGFVGVGVMNSAIIRGICRQLNAQDAAVPPVGAKPFKPFFKLPLLLSPRGSSNVASLLKEFGPEKIKVINFYVFVVVGRISTIVYTSRLTDALSS